MGDKFTTRQQKFIELYSGNGTEAARLAGYSGDDKTLANVALKLLRKAEIKSAIEKRQTKSITKHIASREERQAFWTKVMEDSIEDMKNRLKASELLGKSNADFTEKIEHSGKLTLEDLIVESNQPPK